MSEPEERPSALEALRRHRREAELLADEDARAKADQQLRQDVEGTLSTGDPSPEGPLPEERELLRGLAFERGTALCLSGQGYKAMLFHAGGLIRLNQLGVLARVDRVASVSGGAIVAGVLGLAWPRLEFGTGGVAANLMHEVVEPLRRLASTNVDTPIAVVLGRGVRRLVDALDTHLFKGATLQELPEKPRVVIGATNLQSGAIWSFSDAFMGDLRVGLVRNPEVPLARAVAASAAALTPLELPVSTSDYDPDIRGDLSAPPFTTGPQLVDGTYTDSLALENPWKRFQTILASDGSGRVRPVPDVTAGVGPARMINVVARVAGLAHVQVRNLYRRQLLNAFESGARQGAYWGLQSDPADFGLPDALNLSPEMRRELLDLPARLSALSKREQELLLYYGYAVADVAIRRFVVPGAPPPAGLAPADISSLAH